MHSHSIQYLRAIAALMVVGFHCFYSVEFMRDMTGYGWLQRGVDIFFVISGFVMVRSTSGRSQTPVGFLNRRFQRIVPIYWLATFISLEAISGEWLFKLGSFLFLPLTNPVSGLIEPIVQPGWTLLYEMFFYGIFAASLFLRENLRFGAVAATLFSLVLVGFVTGGQGILGFYSNSIVLEFLLGMAIAKYRLAGHWVLAPLGLAALYWFSSANGPRILLQGLPAAALVAGMLALEHRIPRWKYLSLIGDASYAIYVFHIVVLSVVVSRWHLTGIDNIWFIPMAFAAILAAGIAIHVFVEKPLMTYFRRKRDGGGATVTSSDVRLARS